MPYCIDCTLKITRQLVMAGNARYKVEKPSVLQVKNIHFATSMTQQWDKFRKENFQKNGIFHGR